MFCHLNTVYAIVSSTILFVSAVYCLAAFSLKEIFLLTMRHPKNPKSSLRSQLLLLSVSSTWSHVTPDAGTATTHTEGILSAVEKEQPKARRKQR